MITSTLVLLAYLVVGLVAWQVHPGERIGLLFTITGYAWLLPSLTNLHYALPFTVGTITVSLYPACLAHLALAWPYGRLRSRLDRVVVAVNYCWNVGNNAVGILFWNPRTNGCSAACPANLFLVDSSNWLQSDITKSALDRRNLHNSGRRCPDCRALVDGQGLFTAGNDVAHLGRHADRCVHWPAGGPRQFWSLRPGALRRRPADPIAAPAAYAIGMFRARSARGAVGAALVGLEPGPARPGCGTRWPRRWVTRPCSLRSGRLTIGAM